jgi:1-acyl-sn-glycerol-3-phosphate acyltransferase
MEPRDDFQDIRPYRDREVPQVMRRLLGMPSFHNMMKFVHPEWSGEELQERIGKVSSIDDFQKEIAHPSMRRLVNSTVSELSLSGLENIKKGASYLFISNHRDIILDSAILNILLFENGFDTIQTAIGSNLLSSELITDLTKLNKNFVVKRNTSARELYENSVLLSSYISSTINEHGESIWIAQREGRTKDGLDKTQPGLLKMLSISCKDALRDCFKALRVTPVAISYEYDPCDVLKVPELKAISRDEPYEKAPDEDFNSIIQGLTGQKGRVHLSIGKTLKNEFDALADIPNVNDKLRELGELIDRQIHKNYRLWPTNYMAFDLLEGKHSRPDLYSKTELENFKESLNSKLKERNLNSEEDLTWLLRMYANPVKNQLAVSSL